MILDQDSIFKSQHDHMVEGSTLISAVAGNEDVLDNVYAIDNFSEFDSAGETEKIFRNNLAKFLRNDGSKVQFFNEDCFGFDVDELEPIDIFFYDGSVKRLSTLSRLLLMYLSLSLMIGNKRRLEEGLEPL